MQVFGCIFKLSDKEKDCVDSKTDTLSTSVYDSSHFYKHFFWSNSTADHIEYIFIPSTLKKPHQVRLLAFIRCTFHCKIISNVLNCLVRVFVLVTLLFQSFYLQQRKPKQGTSTVTLYYNCRKRRNLIFFLFNMIKRFIEDRHERPKIQIFRERKY